MKSLQIQLLKVWLLLPFLFIACSNEDDVEIDQPAYLRVKPVTISVKEAPFSGNFTVNTNLQWIVKEKPSWVTLDKDKGNGTEDINLSITTSTVNSRTGEIVVISEDGLMEGIVEVTQNGNTLSVVTGECISTKKGTSGYKWENKIYKYKHEFTLEFTVHGSHLASEIGVTGHTIKGAFSDKTYNVVSTVYSDNSLVSLSYKAFAKNKLTGSYVYGKEKKAYSN